MLAVIVCAYFVVSFPAFRSSLSKGATAPYDFPHDYIGGRQLLAGKSIYPDNYKELLQKLLLSQGIEPDPQILYINPHPPFADILLAPLWFLPFHTATVVWELIEIICMMLVVYLLLKSEQVPMKYFPLIVLFTLAAQPFQSNLITGQITIVLVLFIVVAWFLYKKGHETMSGVFIALATMLKFYPGLFILFFLINKKWKPIVAAIVTGGLVLLLTLMLTKDDIFRFFFIIMPADLRFWQADLVNFSLNGFFSRLFLPMITLRTTAFMLFISPFIKNLLYYSTSGLLLLYLALHARKYDYNNGPGFSIFATLSLIISPFCWDHYRTLLLLPFVILIKEISRGRNKFELLISMVSLVFVSINEYSLYFDTAVHKTQMFLYPGRAANIFIELTFYSLPLYGMLLLLYLNFRIIRKISIEESRQQRGKEQEGHLEHDFTKH